MQIQKSQTVAHFVVHQVTDKASREKSLFKELHIVGMIKHNLLLILSFNPLSHLSGSSSPLLSPGLFECQLLFGPSL